MKRTLPLAIAALACLGVFLLLRWSSGASDAAGPPTAGGTEPASLTASDEPAALDAQPLAAGPERAASTETREEVADPRPALRIRGRLEADPRAPLAGAVVRLVERRLRGGRSAPAGPFGKSYGGVLPIAADAAEFARAEVDDSGAFALSARGVSSELELVLLLDHDHYLLPTPVAVPPARADGDVDVGTLQPLLGALVVGRLHGFTDPGAVDVKAVAELDVMAPARDPWLFAGQLATSARAPVGSRPDGTFAIRAVAPSPKVHVRADARATPNSTEPGSERLFGTSDSFSLTAGETREVSIHARPSAAATVVVRDASGELLPGARVSVTTTAGALTAGAAARASDETDAQGIAHVAGLVPGGNRFAIEAKGHAPLRQAHELAAGWQRLEFTLAEGARIAGFVLDDAGSPVAGARVAAEPALEIPMFGDVSGMTGASAFAAGAEDSPYRSGSDGVFAVTGLPDGSAFTVVAIHPEHAPQIAPGVTPGTADLRIVLRRLARFAGRVLAADGHTPLATFDVQLVTKGMLGMEEVQHHERVRASADGRFAFRATPGAAGMRIEAPGLGTAQLDVRAEPGEDVEVGDVVMQASAQVAGRVVDEDGAPVAGARVQIKRGGVMDQEIFAAMSGSVRLAATTDADGRFRLRDVTPGTIRLRAVRAGFAPADSSRVEVVAGEVREDVVLTLDHGGSIAGRLLLPPGTRTVDWDVHAGDLRGANPPAAALLAADGSFRLENLAPGPYKVQAMNARSFASAMAENMTDAERPNVAGLLGSVMRTLVQTQCHVRRGETTEVELDGTQLEVGGSRLVVDVRVGDHALAEGFLEVRAAGEGGRVTPIAAGRAEVEGLRPGPVTLQVRTGLGFAAVGDPQTTTVPDDGEARFELHLPGGELAGRVVDAGSGEPIRGASVRAHRVDDVARAAAEIGFALTGGDGTFRFQGLAPGTYSVVADEVLAAGREGSSGRIEGLSLRAGEHRDDLVLRARTGARVAVHVRDAAGVPVRHATVLLVDADGQPAVSLPVAFTDAEGRADLAGLPDGRVRAIARVAHLAPGTSDLRHAVGGEELRLDVVLEPGTDVKMHLEDADGQPLPGARIALRIGEGPWLPSTLLGTVSAGADFELGALPPGAFRLRVEHPATGSFEVERTVPAGRRAALTVTAPRR